MVTIVDTSKLEAQATELRTAMMAALTSADDAKVRKLGNELATINKQLLDARGEAEAGARQDYRVSLID